MEDSLDGGTSVPLQGTPPSSGGGAKHAVVDVRHQRRAGETAAGYYKDGHVKITRNKNSILIYSQPKALFIQCVTIF